MKARKHNILETISPASKIATIRIVRIPVSVIGTITTKELTKVILVMYCYSCHKLRPVKLIVS